MLLKQLELQGFKTFAASAAFDFASGITAIVGPNGSGKSNIADAIRWVLGEQRQSQLRIKRIEDLIFAGSRQRPRQGMAEVSITLDNSAHWLPLDFEEVKITRRVYRSGESEFLVNGARLRTRDLLEMLEKGGIGRDAYVVVGQGLVDAALSLRPSERRGLIETAAGIRFYQAKKQESLDKLSETKLNLVRINDILNEIAPRLAGLQVQAQRAQEYTLLARDLQESLRLWYGYHWQERWAALQRVEARRAEMTEFVSLQRQTIQEFADQLAALAGEQARLRQQLSGWHQESSALHSRIEEQDRHLAVTQERQRLLAPQQADLAEEIAALQGQRAEQAQRLEAAQAELARLAEQRNAIAARLQAARARWEQEKRKRSELERALGLVRERSFRAAAAITDCQTRLAGLGERRQEFHREAEAQRANAAARVVDLNKLEEALRAQQEAESAQMATIAQQEAEIARLREQLAAEQRRLEGIERNLSRLQQEAAGLRNRQQVLERMRQELSGYYPGVRAVMQAAERRELRGVHGPLVRLLRIAPELDAAIEVALGAHLQDIVVERWEDAESAIALLKRTGGGRATFLPLDTLRAPRPQPAPSGPGVLGLASALLQVDERYRLAVDLLLGQTVVVEDLPVARRVLHEIKGGFRLVTLEGDLVLASGSVSGGSRQAADGKIALERDWQELPGKLAALEADLRELTEQRQRVEAERLGLEQQAQAATLRAAEQRRQLEAQRQEQARLERQRERLREEIAYHDHAAQRADKESAALDAREQELRAQLAATEQQCALLANELEKGQKQIEALPLEELQRAALAAESEVALAARNYQEQERALQAERQNQQRLAQQIAQKIQRQSELQADLDGARERLKLIQREAATLRQRLESLRQQIEPAEDQVVALDKSEKQLRDSQERGRNRLHELETQEQQVILERRLAQEELQRLQKQIEEDLGPVTLPQRYPQQLRLSLDGAESTLPPLAVLPDNLEADIRELRARLRRLGGFNPNAPQEYKELLKRHTFLASQAADLEKAIESLHKVIAELDEVMEREFAQTFAAVAQAFSEYFALLFGGGTAKLTLTEAEEGANDGNTAPGIEIIARPPGKRLQNLALLSGGERALTASALLFAILKTKPLPFCVLDEVDAMLDEANVGRFRDALREMSARTQFIVITHNRHTINAADMLYGISMRQDGVSTALSLRLEEAEREAGLIAENGA